MDEQKGRHDEVAFLNYTYKSASEVLRSVNRVYLCVLYVSQEKTATLSGTAVCDSFLKRRWGVFSEGHELGL